jgi:hypothetical protein
MDITLSSEQEYWPLKENGCYFRIEEPPESISDNLSGELIVENGSRATFNAQISVQNVTTLEENELGIVLVYVQNHDGKLSRNSIASSKLSFIKK